jgi:L-arabinokinase
MDVAALGALDDYRFVMTGRWTGLPANATALAPEQLETVGLGYEDLVAAADVIVTKPGYGIVSDAIGAGTRLVYTERGDFPEYPILVREMARYLPCAHVSNEELLAGRLAAGLRAALDQPFPPPPDLGGASVAARRILEMAS